MDKVKCLRLLREIKDAAFATVDETGGPQVRIIDVMLSDDRGIYFCTARGKDFHRQLMADGRVAVTGLDKSWRMVRLTGRARPLEDTRAWIDRIFRENPSMNEVYPGDSRYILEPFIIDQGRLELFDLGQSPIYRESFALGEDAAEDKGFIIGENCIGCGSCAQRCPQQCIRPGSPYAIDQSHCLHCGLCFESCPVGAIEQRRDQA